jgi:hypothetical protein
MELAFTPWKRFIELCVDVVSSVYLKSLDMGSIYEFNTGGNLHYYRDPPHPPAFSPGISADITSGEMQVPKEWENGKKYKEKEEW